MEFLKPWLFMQRSTLASELQETFKGDGGGGGGVPLLQDQVSPSRGHHPPPTARRSPPMQSHDQHPPLC